MGANPFRKDISTDGITRNTGLHRDGRGLVITAVGRRAKDVYIPFNFAQKLTATARQLKSLRRARQNGSLRNARHGISRKRLSALGNNMVSLQSDGLVNCLRGTKQNTSLRNARHRTGGITKEAIELRKINATNNGKRSLHLTRHVRSLREARQIRSLQ